MGKTKNCTVYRCFPLAFLENHILSILTYYTDIRDFVKTIFHLVLLLWLSSLILLLFDSCLNVYDTISMARNPAVTHTLHNIISMNFKIMRSHNSLLLSFLSFLYVRQTEKNITISTHFHIIDHNQKQ